MEFLHLCSGGSSVCSCYLMFLGFVCNVLCPCNVFVIFPLFSLKCLMLYISPEALLLQDLFKFYSSEYSLF